MNDDEMARLNAATTEAEWNAACDDVKRARGGRYPEDWFPRVVLSGLVGRKSEEFAARRARVDDWRRRHRVAVAAEEAERERAALAAKMKGDKAAAELVLGTAQEMGR